MSVPVLRVLSCLDVDPVTGVCSAEVWVEQPMLIPPLSVGEGAQIGFAIFGLWALAWCLRPVVYTILPSFKG